MKLKDKANLFYEYALNLFPNAKCELDYYDDYSLLVAVILSAQTTDKRVNIVTKELFKKYPSIMDLSKADIMDIMEIIKSLGLYKNKAKNILLMSKKVVSEYNSVIPNKKEELLKLDGVGVKTANVFLAEYYNLNYIAVDTHVKRVAIRLGFANLDSNVLEIENNLMKLYKKELYHNIHHLMIFFGRYHCISKNPKCEICQLKNICNYYKKNC